MTLKRLPPYPHTPDSSDMGISFSRYMRNAILASARDGISPKIPPPCPLSAVRFEALDRLPVRYIQISKSIRFLGLKVKKFLSALMDRQTDQQVSTKFALLSGVRNGRSYSTAVSLTCVRIVAVLTSGTLNISKVVASSCEIIDLNHSLMLMLLIY